MSTAKLVSPEQLLTASANIIVDCRFSLADAGAGRLQYEQGHIPGAHYLDLNCDLSGEVQAHGGRHPLPEPRKFVNTLASIGVGPDTEVIAYDDSNQAYASRLWWMMRSVGYKPPALLDGGYQAWLSLGQIAEIDIPGATPIDPVTGCKFSGVCDLAGLREAQGRSALVVDSREARRYQGLEEPIDSHAGHIPGAVNRPWQGVTNSDGSVRSIDEQRLHLGDIVEATEIVVYCGSGVTACVNLFSLALVGREDAVLYSGSWSDWCSYL